MSEQPQVASMQQVKPSQLAQVFGPQQAKCLQQMAGQTVQLPVKTYVNLKVPVEYTTTLEKTTFMNVALPTNYKSMTLSSRQQSLGGVTCAQQAPPMVVAPQQQACPCSSCTVGPYVSGQAMAAPSMAQSVGYGAATAAGLAAAGYTGYGDAGQMAYAPFPGASHQVGTYPASALAAGQAAGLSYGSY